MAQSKELEAATNDLRTLVDKREKSGVYTNTELNQQIEAAEARIAAIVQKEKETQPAE